ncbi:hypothetical protein COV20_00215 [Candidatus Woesearchaeota archaeon CG10_big_fil_rev_8_21_14_0_10_45_16]|nr:MAG: hypothetical protein COV20_00215 [Candidatus Woesearchaeota archaeon CG10_big_fil_rev_8_21_14_0_10_45_16]
MKSWTLSLFFILLLIVTGFHYIDGLSSQNILVQDLQEFQELSGVEVEILAGAESPEAIAGYAAYLNSKYSLQKIEVKSPIKQQCPAGTILIGSSVPGLENNKDAQRQACCRPDQCVTTSGKCVDYDSEYSSGFICGDKSNWDRCERIGGKGPYNKLIGESSDGGDFICNNGEWVEDYDLRVLATNMSQNVWRRRQIRFKKLLDINTGAISEGFIQNELELEYEHSLYSSFQIILYENGSFASKYLAEGGQRSLEFDGIQLPTSSKYNFEQGLLDGLEGIFISVKDGSKVLVTNGGHPINNADQVFVELRRDNLMHAIVEENGQLIEFNMPTFFETRPNSFCSDGGLVRSYLPNENRNFVPQRSACCFLVNQCVDQNGICIDQSEQSADLTCGADGNWGYSVQSYVPSENRSSAPARTGACQKRDQCIDLDGSCTDQGEKKEAMTCGPGNDWLYEIESYIPGQDRASPSNRFGNCLNADQCITLRGQCLDYDAVTAAVFVCSLHNDWQKCGEAYGNEITRIEGDYSDGFDYICNGKQWILAGDEPQLEMDFLINSEVLDISDQKIYLLADAVHSLALDDIGFSLNLRTIKKEPFPENVTDEEQFWQELYQEQEPPQLLFILDNVEANWWTEMVTLERDGAGLGAQFTQEYPDYCNPLAGREGHNYLMGGVINVGDGNNYFDRRGYDYWAGVLLHELYHRYPNGNHVRGDNDDDRRGNDFNPAITNRCLANSIRLGYVPPGSSADDVKDLFHGQCIVLKQDVRKSYDAAVCE